MIVVIDNYDSFTYNLVQHLGELGAELQVFRNDHVTVEEIEALHPTHIVISPGPGTPEDGKRIVGISNDVIRHFHKRVPILGVCLGLQCIGHVFGGRVVQAPRLMHGKTSLIHHGDHPIFEGVPDQFLATRYHSLIVEKPLPEALIPIAWSEEGELMGLRHRSSSVIGLQFHPESILTGAGKRILRNFLETPFSLRPLSAHKSSSVSRGTAEGPSVEEVRMDIKEAIGKVMLGEGLSGEEAEAVMSQIMAGEATPAQIGAFLTALRIKGETVEEITGCARAMRSISIPVRPQRRDLVDTCGTGGDRSGTFNISTTAAFVVAGAGLAVAKHGNRSVSSRCGSADLLEALEVNLELTPEQAARCIDEVGIGFLFAPRLHPAMKHAIGPRREMGVRTIFNILGPLTNPAGATRQSMGVYDPNLTNPLAHVLGKLGAREAFVVHGADGLDELSTTGINRVSHLQDGSVKDFSLDPAELGLPEARLEDLRGGTADENAQITQAILAGEWGPRRDVVLLNAAAALVAGGMASDFEEGLQQAAEAIDSGRARQKLEGLVAFTQGCATAC